MLLKKDGLLKMDELDNRLLKRFTVLKKIEYYIKESVYYRSFCEDFSYSKRNVLWNATDDSGKIKVYEDTTK
jgi:hypothetical protein